MLESLKAVYLQKMGWGGGRVKRSRFDLAVARKPYVLEDQRLKMLCMNVSVKGKGKESFIWQELYRATTTMNRVRMGPNNEL
jgi:hypothetical protein